jgi:hypothetical protein
MILFVFIHLQSIHSTDNPFSSSSPFLQFIDFMQHSYKQKVYAECTAKRRAYENPPPGTPQVLGMGTYGKVTKVVHRESRRFFALKEFFPKPRPILKEEEEGKRDAASPAWEGIPRSVVREYNILSEFKHENIIKIFDFFTNPEAKTTYFVMEYADTDLLV